jgi:two-component system response regulator DegU
LWPVDVLMVEDFEQFRQFIGSVLGERTEFRLVGEASDGLEAVRKIEELRPDLVLLDIGLPNLNGIEVAERARRLVPHAKLLFISQESSFDVIEKAFGAGGRGYVHKPHAVSDLLPAMEAVLEGRQFVGTGLEFGAGCRSLTVRIL